MVIGMARRVCQISLHEGVFYDSFVEGVIFGSLFRAFRQESNSYLWTLPKNLTSAKLAAFDSFNLVT
ncbi:MAG: hypothetical protein RIT27_602 [Pseudomonadota bacterium]|jgi:hypothetical protein